MSLFFFLQAGDNIVWQLHHVSLQRVCFSSIIVHLLQVAKFECKNCVWSLMCYVQHYIFKERILLEMYFFLTRNIYTLLYILMAYSYKN